MASGFRKFVNEPLVHFALLGLILYWLNGVFNAAEDNPRRIVVKPSVYTEISQAFQTGRGRKPTPEEMEPLVQTWVSNEVLYREARLLQLEQGDEMIRQRIMQKMRVMIASSIDVPNPTEEDLRVWFMNHKENYDLPAHFDFSFARLDTSEEAARAKAAAWNDLEEGAQIVEPGTRVLNFAVRPRYNVVEMLGEDFTRTLEAMPVGEWQAVEGPTGWAIVRLERLDPPSEATFEMVRADVDKRWRDQRYKSEGARQVAEMRAQYEVIYADPPADVMDTGEADEPETAQ